MPKNIEKLVKCIGKCLKSIWFFLLILIQIQLCNSEPIRTFTSFCIFRGAMAWWVNELWRRCAAIINPLHLLCLFFSCVQYILKTANMPLFEVQQKQLAMVGEIFHSCLSFPPPTCFLTLGEWCSLTEKHAHLNKCVDCWTFKTSVGVFIVFWESSTAITNNFGFFPHVNYYYCMEKNIGLASKARDVISLDLQI